MTKVRKGQLVVPFGVGAIVEIGQESFVNSELSFWRSTETGQMAASELERLTGKAIRTPFESAPFTRFPRWLFCPKCRRMRRMTPDAERRSAELGAVPRCPDCRKVEMAPIGFVQACSDGHLDDIDWHAWAHLGAHVSSVGRCARETSELRFLTTGTRGGDWDTLEIECTKCLARRSLVGLTTRPLPWKCRGRQPWATKVAASCDKQPTGHRRGDSNLYFPETRSALDIVGVDSVPARAFSTTIEAELETGRFKGSRGLFEMLLKRAGADDVLLAVEQQLVDLAREHGVSVAQAREAFVEALRQKLPDAERTEIVVDIDQDAIVAREWPVLTRLTSLNDANLILQPQAVPEDWPPELRKLVHRITLIPRLREVRALLGYRRIDATSGNLLPLDSTGTARWLPGVEVWGEGVFLQFDEDAVTEWERALPARETASIVALQRRVLESGRRGQSPTARFVALHTFSHALLRRLAFNAGYSSTSLRERIYAASGPHPMAGILIYTADGDSEGSLGGLVRMGSPARLLTGILGALNDASWCSADPVCSETGSQGVKGLNGAACHACVLVAETSCAHGNVLLDRRLMLNANFGRLTAGLVRLPAFDGARQE